MDRKELEILLKEYETCQSSTNSLGNQAWVSTSIMLTVNLLLLAQVITNILPNIAPSNGFANLIFLIILSAAMVFILKAFAKYDKRVSFQIRINHDRMREIELEVKGIKNKLMLQKNWRVRGLDILYNSEEKHAWWGKLDVDIKTMIENISNKYPEKKTSLMETRYQPPTISIFLWVPRILIVFWLLSIASALLMQLWPQAYNFMFN